MMFGLGLLMMLVVLGVPILLVAGVLAGAWKVLGQRPPAAVVPPLPQAPRYCAHCGQGLQAAWTHCPNCGTPLGTA